MHFASHQLVLVATILDGLIAGASLNRTIVELPAFRRIGAPAWATFSRNADLRTGRFWYPTLAIAGTILTIGGDDNPETVQRSFDQFRRWHAVRATLQGLAFGAAVLAAL